MEYQPVGFQPDVYKAFDQFETAYDNDKVVMARRITERAPFVGRLSILNNVDPHRLLKALFYGCELELSPAEKLQEKIKETQAQIQGKHLHGEDPTSLTDYLDGLQEAALIMGL